MRLEIPGLGQQAFAQVARADAHRIHLPNQFHAFVQLRRRRREGNEPARERPWRKARGEEAGPACPTGILPPPGRRNQLPFRDSDGRLPAFRVAIGPDVIPAAQQPASGAGFAAAGIPLPLLRPDGGTAAAINSSSLAVRYPSSSRLPMTSSAASRTAGRTIMAPNCQSR